LHAITSLFLNQQKEKNMPFSSVSRDAAQVASSFKHFVGSRGSELKIVKSDAAGEILKAVVEQGWLSEASVPSCFPHNSQLEREIRSFQEVARSLFLQAGSAARPQLWPQACSYVATIMSAKLVDASGITRWKKGFGDEFLGPVYLLGQLAFVRTKQPGKFKLNPNAERAIFVGWRLGFSLRYKGVSYFVLYSHLKEDLSLIPISQFHNAEVYTPKEMTFPLHLAAEKALHDLEDPRRAELLDIDSLPIPFVDSITEAKQKSRRVYITYKRMREVGATPGCKGCDNDTSSHNKECIERFERAFGKTDESGDIVEPAPDEDVLQQESLPTIDNALTSDEFDVSPSPSIREEASDEEFPECPPGSPEEPDEHPDRSSVAGLLVAAEVSNDACSFLPRVCPRHSL
jgi:hypothetical protein